MQRKILRKQLVCLALVLVFISTVSLGAEAGELYVHFIDVGQGDSVLIQTPTGTNVLVDAGVTKSGRESVVPYLKKLGIKHLDLVVMTHPHFDHIGGLVPVIEAYSVGRILADGQIHTTKTYEELLQLILQKEIPFSLARTQGQLTVQGLDEVAILNPKEPMLKGLNNNSVVLWFRHGQVTFLLTGDIEKEAEARIVAEEELPRAKVLKVAHHGSNTSSIPQFIEAVAPEYAVIQVGAGNSYGHPNAETLQTLEKVGAEVGRTDLDGTVIVISDGTSYRVVKEK
ncbi:MAG: MBL fold metallo-hydrolase [Firmicutes bacterium]|nr:MBL fold metallo-hydrolase [Bacillota bacterium]